MRRGFLAAMFTAGGLAASQSAVAMDFMYAKNHESRPCRPVAIFLNGGKMQISEDEALSKKLYDLETGKPSKKKLHDMEQIGRALRAMRSYTGPGCRAV